MVAFNAAAWLGASPFSPIDQFGEFEAVFAVVLFLVGLALWFGVPEKVITYVCER